MEIERRANSRLSKVCCLLSSREIKEAKEARAKMKASKKGDSKNEISTSKEPKYANFIEDDDDKPKRKRGRPRKDPEEKAKSKKVHSSLFS
jgi:AT hook motif.